MSEQERDISRTRADAIRVLEADVDTNYLFDRGGHSPQLTEPATRLRLVQRPTLLPDDSIRVLLSASTTYDAPFQPVLPPTVGATSSSPGPQGRLLTG